MGITDEVWLRADAVGIDSREKVGTQIFNSVAFQPEKYPI